MIVLLPCSCRLSFHARPHYSQNKRPIMTIITTNTRSRISPWPHALSRLSFGLYRKLVVVHLHHPTAARQLLLPALEAATEQSPESHNKWQQQQQQKTISNAVIPHGICGMSSSRLLFHQQQQTATTTTLSRGNTYDGTAASRAGQYAGVELLRIEYETFEYGLC